MREKVYIAIGSNKGNRERNVIKAIRCLQESIFLLKVSSFMVTPPEEGVSGGEFLNGIVYGETGMHFNDLFYFLRSVEISLGRTFPHKKGDDREIDLDLIMYGKKVAKSSSLQLPHPRYLNRYFVVLPLLELSPELIDPETGKSVADIYKNRCI